jgi:ADP-ribose pyrophosphatase YjhB (NUDIX family)
MQMNSVSDEELILKYRKTLGKYPKPSVTADIVAVRPKYSELTRSQWRENPEFALEFLFIKRAQWPYEGYWAIPGGFIGPNESVDEGAIRELKEETSLTAKRLIPVGVFSKPTRDMRAWIISNVFVSIHRCGEDLSVRGGDDAASAKWLTLRSPQIVNGRFSLPFFDGDKMEFCLTGTYREEDIGGSTVLGVGKNPLAFDHGEIIAQTFLRILSYDIRKLVFFFLPEKFTLSKYIDVYQYLTQNSISPANIPSFRRQLTATKEPILEVCEGEWEELDGRGHAPAKLYKRKEHTK